MVKVEVDLQREGSDVDMEEICPFMSNFKTGAGSFIGVVKCIKSKCKLWNKNKKDCSFVSATQSAPGRKGK